MPFNGEEKVFDNLSTYTPPSAQSSSCVSIHGTFTDTARSVLSGGKDLSVP